MSREVKSIKLVLENCEIFKVERKHIGELHIGKVERIIGRSACNSISEDFIASEFHIQIHRDADIKTNDSSMFKRIEKYNDITQIAIEYTNGDFETLFTHWCEENDMLNNFQSTVISEVNKDLFIVVDENSNVLKEFEYEIKEDDGFTWDMYIE